MAKETVDTLVSRDRYGNNGFSNNFNAANRNTGASQVNLVELNKGRQSTPEQGKSKQTITQPTTPSVLDVGTIGFGEINKEFSQWNPSSDWGKMMKGTYMMNTLQQQQDTSTALALAKTNAGLQNAMMTQAASLELANQAALMDIEEGAKTRVMGTEFNLQSRFAQDEYARGIGKMAFDKDVQTALLEVRGDVDKQKLSVQGTESRLGTRELGNQNRLTQAQSNIEKQQQAMLAAQLQKGSASYMSGIKKDETSFQSGIKKDEQRFGQQLQKDSTAFQQALAKDSAGYQQGLDLEKAAYMQSLSKGSAQTASGIRKDEAAFSQGLGKDSQKFSQQLSKDSEAFSQALGKDSAGFGSGIRKSEAAYSQALGKDTAAFGSGLRKDEGSFASAIRKDEAAFGQGLQKDTLTTQSDLRMKEADYANRLSAKTRADKSRMMSQAASAF